MSIAESVAAIVLGVAAVNVVIWIPVILWFRRRTREARARLAAAIDGERVICPPEKGNYRGSTAPGYPMVNNNAVIALTDRQLICITVTGKAIQLPVESITGVREAKVFKSSAVGGRTHLIVRIPSGELGFFVSDNTAWLTAIRTATGQKRLTDNLIPYDHADRLNAILATYFPFLRAVGFSVAESSYDAARLSGRMLLRRPDVVIEARLRNDDLDLAIAPAVAAPTYVKLNLLVLYFKRAGVNYAEFVRRRSGPEPSQEAIWRAEAADVAAHLDRIVAFAQAEGFAERNADRERYEAEVAADVDRQIAEYESRQD